MDQTRFTLRLPTQLHEQISELAAKNMRSLNSEIIMAIQEWLDGSGTVFDRNFQDSQTESLEEKVIR